MKNLTFIFLMSMMVSSCHSVQKEKDEDRCVQYVVSLDSINTTRIDSLSSVVFETSFENDTFKIYVDSQEVFNQSITTNPSTGNAGWFSFNYRKGQIVELQYKDCPLVKITEFDKFANVYITKSKAFKKVELTCTNEIRMYK